MKIVVVGGTGLIGSKVVPALRAAGHEAVVAAPSTGVDTITGEGLKDVLVGADVVVDLSNAPDFSEGPVMEFFRTSGENLMAAEADAGVKHHVALSIVGADRLPEGHYLRAKVVQEQLITESGIPWTIIRATQFFEFLRAIADGFTEGDVVRAPSAYMQCIAADDVAGFVAETALADPRNARFEIAGPDRIGIDELLRTVLEADGDARTVVTDSHAKYFGTELESTSLVPHGEARIGSVGFAEWLAAHPIAGSNP
jgi:uncharacterized protein YbjT (DUF2867 family)